jgi:hypothetical protein
MGQIRRRALILTRLRNRVGAIKQENGDLLIWLLTDIDRPMHAGARLFPLDLPWPNLNTLTFASIAVLDGEEITSQDHCDPAKSIAMPRHRLTGSKTQTTYHCGSVLKHDFVRHFDTYRTIAEQTSVCTRNSCEHYSRIHLQRSEPPSKP